METKDNKNDMSTHPVVVAAAERITELEGRLNRLTAAVTSALNSAEWGLPEVRLELARAELAIHSQS